MKKSKVDELLGKKVEVTIYDGKTHTGILKKTGTEDLIKINFGLYCAKGRYFVTENPNYCFRSSHITKLREVW